MKIVFEKLANKIPPHNELKVSDFIDMRILKELESSKFIDVCIDPNKRNEISLCLIRTYANF